MIKIKLLFIIFIILTITAHSETYLEIYKGRVLSVSDGDTFTIKAKEKNIKIRLFGVDSPEKKQKFGIEAMNYTRLMLYNKFVEIKVISKDKYNREVADVFLEDGRCFNHEIVKTGYAWWYQYFAPNDRTLKALEYSARNKKIGLWKNPNPEAPWKFRAKNRN